MTKVTVSLDGGGQLTVETQDKTPLGELQRAFKERKPGQPFTVHYLDADIFVPDGAKVLGAAVTS